MNKTFELPDTKLCSVVWFSGKKPNQVKYRAIIPTPRDNTALQIAMLQHGCGMSQIGGVYPHAPAVPGYYQS